MAVSRIPNPDLCVIGGGVAGFSMALAAVGLGLSCVLVDKQKTMGRSQARDLALDMLIAAEPGEPFGGMRERIGRAVAAAMPNHSGERLKAAGVTLLEGTGRFVDPRTIVVGSARIRARRFVIATGARPIAPKIDGIELVRVLTPETLFELTELPARLAIIGGAPVAFELAQAFRRLGSAVSLIGTDPDIDPELWVALRTSLVRDGIELRSGAVQTIVPRGAGLTIIQSGDNLPPIEANHVLVAEGMLPFTESLGLEPARVRHDGSGPMVGANLRTSNRRIFAIGDVLGAASAHPAGVPVQVGTVLRAAFLRQPMHYRPDRVPRVIRTSPSVAEVGVSEKRARKLTREVRILRWPFSDNERAVATGSAQGFVKIVATPEGRVLGVGIVGAQAAELIAPWCLAIARDIPLDAMASVPTAQPSLSDTSRRAALAYVVSRLRRPWIKRVLGVMRLLG